MKYNAKKLVGKEIAVVVLAGQSRVVYRGKLITVYNDGIEVEETVEIPKDKKDKSENIEYTSFKQLHFINREKIVSLTIPLI